LTQVTSYASVLAKIGAEKSKLISETKLRALAETKTLTEFAAQLRETTYQLQMAKVPLPLTSRKLERVFNENLTESYLKMIRNSPKTVTKFLGLSLLRFEVENIKTLIKAVAINLSPEERLLKIYFSAENTTKKRSLIEESAKATNLKQLANTLKESPYASAFSKGLQIFEEKGSTAGFDILVDKVFYETLFDSYDSLPKKEKPHAYYYASIENDSFTLLTILRGKVLNFDTSWLKLAVPRNKFNLTSETVESLLVAPDFDSALKIALESHYGSFFAKASSPEETISNADKAFRKAEVQHAKVNTVLEIFNVGAPLAFMKLKEAEVHNLIASSGGIEAGVSPEAILNQMLF
jgi:V/A-type H+-transporting ATPase subunit C